MTDPWTQAVTAMTEAMRKPLGAAPTRPYDPLALFQTMGEFTARKVG